MGSVDVLRAAATTTRRDGGDHRRALGVTSELAPAFVLVLGAATLVGELGHLVGWRLLADPWSSRLTLAGIVLVVASLWVARGRAPSRGLVRVRWPASVPGWYLLGCLLAARVLPFERRSQWFLGGDHLRHLVFTADEAVTGYLDYGTNSYPRAWHTLMALVWTSTGGGSDAEGLRGLVAVLSVGSWCAYSLFALATGHLAATLAERIGLKTRAASLAGLIAGALTLWPSLLSNFESLGFENSVVAALVVAVSARELLSRAPGVRSVVVCAAGVAVMANTWQLLLPAPLIALGVVSVVVLRSGAARTRALTLAALAVSVGVSLPGGLAVLSQVGIGHAVVSDVVVPLPVVLLPLALLATVVLGVRVWRDHRGLWLVAMVLVTAVSAPVLAAAVGVGVSDYYPSKVLWAAGALGLAPLAVLATAGLQAAWDVRGRAVAPVRAGLVAVTGSVLLLCAANPPVFLLHDPGVDGGRVLAAVTSPDAGTARVVWLPGFPDDSRVARILTDFYRVGRPGDPVPQGPLSRDQECELLTSGSDPVVLSTAPLSVVRARYACAPAVRVVPVRGGERTKG